MHARVSVCLIVVEREIEDLLAECREMEFTKVSSGAFKLCYGGFTYTKKAEKKNRIRWECSKRKTEQCKGAVTTSLVVRTRTFTFHLHCA